MNNHTTQNEGMWDRISAGWTGVKTGAKNISTAVSSVASGVPVKLNSVQDAKIKQLFSGAQFRMKPFVSKLNSKNIDTKLNAEIEVKKQILGFVRDFMKMTGEKNPNNVIATLQQPQYKNIADSLLKIGISVPSSSKSPSSTASTSSAASKPTATGTPPKTPIKAPAHAATYNGFTFDSTTGLWSDPKGVPLNKGASNAKTVGYVNAVNKGIIIPENINKITYKEFFI